MSKLRHLKRDVLSRWLQKKKRTKNVRDKKKTKKQLKQEQYCDTKIKQKNHTQKDDFETKKTTILRQGKTYKKKKTQFWDKIKQKNITKNMILRQKKTKKDNFEIEKDKIQFWNR